MNKSCQDTWLRVFGFVPAGGEHTLRHRGEGEHLNLTDDFINIDYSVFSFAVATIQVNEFPEF